MLLMLHGFFLPDAFQLCLPWFGDSVPGRMTMWMGLVGASGTCALKRCLLANGHMEGAVATIAPLHAVQVFKAIRAPLLRLRTIFQALVNVLTALALVAPE